MSKKSAIRPLEQIPALAIAAGSLAALAAVLQVAALCHLLPATVPPPSAVLANVVRRWRDILFHAEATVAASCAGLTAVTMLCLGVTGLLYDRGSAARVALTVGLVVDSTPLIVSAPILGVSLGYGFGAHVVLSMVASLYPLMTGLIRGLNQVSVERRDLFHIMGAGRLQIWWKLGLPTTRPFLFTALKTAAPLALLGALVSEWVGSDRGLGVMMVYALFAFDIPQAWSSVLVVCTIALIYHAALSGLDRLVAGIGETDE